MMTHVAPPILVNGDFSDDFEQRWLLLFVPLLALGVSLILLAKQYRGTVYQATEEFETKNRQGARETPNRLDAWTSLASSVEPVCLSLAHWLVLTSWSKPDSQSIYFQGWVGEFGWVYLSFLYLVRMKLLPFAPSLQVQSFRVHMFYHSSCLYGLHWALTAILFRTSYLKYGTISKSSALTAGFVLTSALFCSALGQPLSVVANEIVATGPIVGRTLRERKASIWGLATFSWLDPIIFKGMRQRLKMTDVWRLVKSDSSSSIMSNFNTYAFSRRGLLLTLLMFLRREFALQAAWASASAVLTFAPTLLLQSILQCIEKADDTSDDRVAWAYLTLMLISGIIYAVAAGQTTWYGQKIALQLRAIILGKVYGKILRRTAAPSPSTLAGASETKSTSRADAGTITNLVVSDSAKIASAGSNAYELWASVPVQVTVALGLLFHLLGPSALAGVVMMLLMTPINSTILKHFSKAAAEAMSASDMRVQETDQVLRNVRMLKLFAWETWFEKKILDKRAKELEALRSRLVWWCIWATIWYTVPFVTTFLSFFVYTVVQGRRLVPSVAFTALSLFNALKAPLDQLVGMVARVRESLESIRRVEAFLQEPDITQFGTTPVASHQAETKTFGFHQATVSWSSLEPQSFMLRAVDLVFTSGQLNIVAGPTGSGKTSILMALLGEMKIIGGTVYAPSTGVAYCAQEAWLLNDTIRNNIVFTSVWNSRRYQETIEACGLTDDLATLPRGESTMVGDKGIALSGGQKQRVALARAVYSSSDYVLLDDCLSAVDSHTAKWLFDRCITGPLMAGRTCILVTHRLYLALPKAAFVTVLNDGYVVASGPPESLTNITALRELIGSVDVHTGEGARQESPRIPSMAFFNADESSAQTEVPSGVSAEFSLAERPAGHIAWAAVATYTSSMGGWLFWTLMIILFLSQQVLAIGANWWLQNFSNAYEIQRPGQPPRRSGFEVSGGNHDLSATPAVGVSHYLYGYGLILLLYTAVSFGRLYVISLGSIKVSWRLHNRLLTSILQAKSQFFDVTTHGTLLNRFSEDIQTLDVDILPMALGTLHFLVAMVLIVILITVLTPKFLLPGILITMAYLAIGRLFLDSSRDLKRIESEQKSPLHQQISESLLGTVTIRAFRLAEHFIKSNHDKVDTVNGPLLYLGAVDNWLSFRLNIMGTTMSFLAGYFALCNIGSISAGAVGLSLTYTITFSENVLWLVRYHALNQQNFTAVERIRDCFHIDHEAPNDIPSTRPGKDWPSSGAITFQNYSARYRQELPLVLRNLNLEIQPRQRVGIVGRTGAGKSSVANALLRNIEAAEGTIMLDGIDISTIGLHDLRKALTLVPQDPSLLVGDLRSNLDPLGQFTDDQILRVLHKVKLIRSGPTNRNSSDTGTTASAAESQFQDLSFQIMESSTNISLGQRQLLCLARAFLRSSKVVILDEATASIDYATDLFLQQTVAELDATVITIAHRLRTIIDYNMVVVMDQGEIVQSGRPWDLIQAAGKFQDLCRDSGTFEELVQLAAASSKRDE